MHKVNILSLFFQEGAPVEIQKYKKLIEFSRTVTLHKRLLGKTRGAGASLGALECWPTNVVGEAENPCFFELVAAGEMKMMMVIVNKEANNLCCW